MSDVDEKFDEPREFVPSVAADHDDNNPRVLAANVHAIRREMRDGFDSIGRALGALTRIEERIIVVIDRQNVIEREQADLRREQTDIKARVAALETKAKRPTRARKK